MWIHLFKVICGLLLTIEIMNESFSDVSVEPGMGLVFSPSLGRGQGRRVRVDTNNTFKGDTRRKLQRGLAPVCLVTSILHCTDIVRNTFYIHLTLSRPLLTYSPSHSLAYAAMGRVLSNRGHTYAVKSVLDVFSEHRAAQFGRNTKVCVRSKHESLAWCARGRISNIPWLLLGNAQNIHTGLARSLTWTGWSQYLVSVPWQEIRSWEKQHFENIIWSEWKMACWEQAGTLANVHIVTQVVSTPHRGTWYPATPGHAVRAQRGRGQTLGQVEIRPNNFSAMLWM